MTRPSHALIDLDALRDNFNLAVELAPKSNTLAVVKANAYGHGALPIARALEPLAAAFAVACCDEAVGFRQGGIEAPLLLLEGFFDIDELTTCAEHNFWLMLENQEQVAALLSARLPRPLRVWLKVDTGMHRLGLPGENVAKVYRQLQQSDNVQGPVVIATHLACADELDNPFTTTQIQRLRKLAEPLKAPLSMANSPALLAWPDSHADWNRPGFILYGNSPFSVPHPAAERLKPVMTLASRVISLRTIEAGESVGYGATWRAQRVSTIATVPLGYGDGYPRNAASGTPVLVNGQRAQLAGRVSMDLITVDVTDLDRVAVGDEVECWGKQLSVNEVAAAADTSAYELLTRIPARLPRIYCG